MHSCSMMAHAKQGLFFVLHSLNPKAVRSRSFFNARSYPTVRIEDTAKSVRIADFLLFWGPLLELNENQR